MQIVLSLSLSLFLSFWVHFCLLSFRSQSIDPMVLVDGIVEVLGNDDKDLEDICDFSFKLILETAVCIFKSESKVSSRLRLGS